TQLWVPESPTWWQRGVFYQIYPRSFRDASGDGLGDLRGILERVEYLAWLGVDAIWLSPIYPSEDVDLGYDVSDYCAVDPRLGQLADFDRLLDALHDVGIKLVLDLVPNHTSDRHPWFLESRRSSDHPRHDWYVWRDPTPDESPPNNWQSYFGEKAWEYAEPPGKWYLHSFHRGQPDLNWNNPEVAQAILEVMWFWLSRGVDGFRVDVLWLLGKDREFRDNPPNRDWHEGLPAWTRLQRVYSEDRAESHERARLLRAVVDEFPDRLMIGEVVLPPARAVAYYGNDLDEAHFPHNFALTEIQEWSAAEVREVVEAYEAVLPPGAWPNWLLGDHDFSRIASRVGPERTRLVQLLLFSLRGTPTCYYGDELGLPTADLSRSDVAVVDPQAAGAPWTNRLTARTPMQWSPARHAGFSEVEPWLPFASDDPNLTVERQRNDPTSVLHLFRSLIGLRRKIPALAVGAYRPLPAPPDVFSFERQHPDGSVEAHLNFAARAREAELAGPRRITFSTAAPTSSAGVRGTRHTLQPYEGVLVVADR
ncbi:MAG TPA: alpha-amylase family glycosyl hydrolase, partial [Gaiellaceae bacterium]|nr:alpha-amylase family glycosyl hydrolase [Gaiellaceae bacterium]